MKKISVLGCGLVGGVIARDLARDPDLQVTVFDRSEEALSRLAGTRGLATKTADLSSPSEIARAVAPADAVVGAVPGFLGRRMLEAVIATRKPVADISFSPEDPFELDARARESGVAAVVDCGVSPGLSNLAAGRAASVLDTIEDLTIYVGGLPRVRRWPYEYGIVFSATDVIEEYTRPSRVRRNGKIEIRPALSEVEPVEFEQVGTLEGFLTDGLRTLLSTIDARNMQEKTLRFPGHAERMRMLRETGFFSEDPVSIRGVDVSPRAVSESLLFRAWKMGEGEEEFTVLRVLAEGSRKGRRQRMSFELFDRTDAGTRTTSMARTTGFPCAIVARMLAAGEYREPGVRALEHLGRDAAAYERMISDLRSRGIAWTEKIEEMSAAEIS